VIAGDYAAMWTSPARAWWWRPMIAAVALFVALPLCLIVSVLASESRGRS
jgi:hypothetical protein